MTKEEAIEETLVFIEPYLKQDVLGDAQAARIGRVLFSNLKRVERDAQKDDYVRRL